MLFKLLWLWLSDILFFVHHFNTDVIVATSSITPLFKIQSSKLKSGTHYYKVAYNRLSWLVAHLRIFRPFMKGKFDPYVLCDLWPLTIDL